MSDYDYLDYSDDYDVEEIELSISDLRAFEEFKNNNGAYLNQLYSSMKTIFETYLFVFNKEFSKMAAKPQHNELACVLGFGMLMRHSLETIAEYLIFENDIVLDKDKTVYDKLTTLYEGNMPNYNENKHKTLIKALDLTNEIAHPHVLEGKTSSLQDLKSFYQTYFRPLMQNHIAAYPLYKRARREKKITNKYLTLLMACLDNFNIKEKITAALTEGCLIRHLTECAVNFYSYDSSVVPTDASTKENQISISGNLDILSKLVKNERLKYSLSINQSILSGLFFFKNFSNKFMHESEFNPNVFLELRKEIAQYYYAVVNLCSPAIVNPRYALEYPVYRPITTTALLCGFLGRFGAHYFYTGNYCKGAILLLVNLLPYFVLFTFGAVAASNFLITIIKIIGVFWPIHNLNSIRRGKQQTAKWGVLPKQQPASGLTIVFIILQLLVATII